MLIKKSILSTLRSFAGQTSQSIIQYKCLALYSYFKNSPKIALGGSFKTKKVGREEQTQIVEEKVKKIKVVETLIQLIKLQQQYFHEKRQQLPVYVAKLNNLLTKDSFQKNKLFFQDIDYKLGKISSQLLLKPNQFIQILLFHSSFKKYDTRTVLPINSGFQHRSTMIVANLMLKNEFTLTQAVTVFQILSTLGSSSLLLNTNFTKFIKNQFQKPNSLQIVKLQHILTILNVRFIKNNHTILQNVTQDHALNYLLNNHQILCKDIKLIIKVQLLQILLKLDVNEFYLSNNQIKNQLIKKLMRDVTLNLHDVWTKQKDTGNKCQQQIGITQLIAVIQCCEYSKHMQISHEINNQLKQIIMTSLLYLLKYYKINSFSTAKSCQQLNLLYRFMFNSLVIQHWINDTKIKQITWKIIYTAELSSQLDITPLIDQMHHSQTNATKNCQWLLKLIMELHSNARKQNVVSFPLCGILIRRLPLNEAFSVFKTIKLQVNKTQNIMIKAVLLSYLMGNKEQKQKQIHHQINSQFQELQLQIPKLFQNERQLFITYTHKLPQIFRDPNLHQTFMEVWGETILILMTTIANQSGQPPPEQQTITILYLGILYSNTRISKSFLQLFRKMNFKDHVVYQYLLQNYPVNYPIPNKYTRSINVFGSPLNFNKVFSTILQVIQSQKMSFIIWELFIKCYTLQNNQTKVQSLNLLETLFMNAYKRQNMRKVVNLSILTNYMSSGIIKGSVDQLRQIFTKAFQNLLKQQQNATFHYHCFIQIMFNALSCGFLTLQIQKQIIGLAELGKLNRTSTMMLLFGVSLKETASATSPLLSQDNVNEQIKYLTILLDNKSIYLQSSQIQSKPKSTGKNMIKANSQFIAILLRSGIPLITNYRHELVNYINGCQFSNLMQLAYAYSPNNFKTQNQQIKLWKQQMRQAFNGRFKHFEDLQLFQSKNHQSILKINS